MDLELGQQKGFELFFVAPSPKLTRRGNDVVAFENRAVLGGEHQVAAWTEQSGEIGNEGLLIPHVGQRLQCDHDVP